MCTLILAYPSDDHPVHPYKPDDHSHEHPNHCNDYPKHPKTILTAILSMSILITILSIEVLPHLKNNWLSKFLSVLESGSQKFLLDRNLDFK